MRAAGVGGDDAGQVGELAEPEVGRARRPRPRGGTRRCRRPAYRPPGGPRPGGRSPSPRGPCRRRSSAGRSDRRCAPSPATSGTSSARRRAASTSWRWPRRRGPRDVSRPRRRSARRTPAPVRAADLAKPASSSERMAIRALIPEALRADGQQADDGRRAAARSRWRRPRRRRTWRSSPRGRRRAPTATASPTARICARRRPLERPARPPPRASVSADRVSSPPPVVPPMIARFRCSSVLAPAREPELPTTVT